MSEPESTDESERSLRRVRKFYQIASEREWQRLEQPNDGALEFAVHKAWISKVPTTSSGPSTGHRRRTGSILTLARRTRLSGHAR